ncbi:MAG: adenosylcobalamin-dependent ribonucleoside-diphosphate reductase [Sediminibacterium sp.]|nr:adenosylcobalamin-dependent ribonucleoside-diphosphate reductase [Sediminibacterium sp.]
MNHKKLQFERRYTKENTAVFNQFQYENRESVIKHADGRKMFEMNKVEVPIHWSQIATDILAQKYFRKAGVPQEDGSLGPETSIKQVVHRLANCWRVCGERYQYFESTNDAQIFYDELVFSLLNQSCAPNSPQWFNTGLFESYGITGKPQGHYFVDPSTKELKKSKSAYERPQPHACFILSVSDDLVNEGGIMDLWTREARIFKYGSGVGSNFSNIRGAGEKLSGGGTSSGLMSFLKIGDRAAGAIKSGGTTRRAAKMVSLDADHPEILEFINWKANEEKKVAALINAGYDHNYEGEAYLTVSGQNSNNSVRFPNSFFKKLQNNEDWELKARTDGSTMKKIKTQDLWNQIADAAWKSADPGLQYDTTINEWHTCPAGGRINASNPCSEYMFLDNTACNLASINLKKFHNPNTLEYDLEGLEYTSRLWTVVLEISVLMAQFPSKEVAELSFKYRTLGLGFANLGACLMISGIPYDSNEARNIAGGLTAIITGTAYKTSAEMASFLGTFDEYPNNADAMLRVMKNHRAAAYNDIKLYENLEIIPQGLLPRYCPSYILTKARHIWDDVVNLGQIYGFRNAQTTVIAPTGTIGLSMDCDTTGVEPDFSIVKFKKLSGGGYFKIINHGVPMALKNLGYSKNEIDAIIQYTLGSADITHSPYFNTTLLLEKGFNVDDIKNINIALKTAFRFEDVLTHYVLGVETLQRLGFTETQFKDPHFNLLNELNLGLTQDQLSKATEYVFGTQTLEGAPILLDEHLPVFDCANKCGEIGTRFIKATGHIKMMASCQPFLSGAISKTINLPNDAKVDEIKQCYFLSWELGLKANALYRDGSKLSQPLSNKSDSETTSQQNASQHNTKNQLIDLSQLSVDELLEEIHKRVQDSPDTEIKRKLSKIVERKTLPTKRNGFTQKVKVNNHVLFIRTGNYADGTLGEIFLDLAKDGSTLSGLFNCFAIAISIGLQYGVPLKEFVEKFVLTRFEPNGITDHPNIKTTSSLVDLIFRVLDFEYLGNTEYIHKLPNAAIITKPEIGSMRVVAPLNNDIVKNNAENNEKQTETPKKEQSLDLVNVAAKNMQSDAPTCTCGHITIRSGTCYKCLNCGNSMGCS